MCRRISRTLMIIVVMCFNLYSQDSQNSEDTPQEKQKPLHHEVVVTANRVETSLKEVASSVTMITREELEKTGKSSVLDALEETLGLSSTQNGPPGSQATVFIRGANSEHTLVMVDGTEVNDPITPTRSYDMSLLLVENIDRIEILRGPQSTLYGSDAMGGVINIITRQNTGKPKFFFLRVWRVLRHLFGDRGSQRQHIQPPLLSSRFSLRYGWFFRSQHKL